MVAQLHHSLTRALKRAETPLGLGFLMQRDDQTIRCHKQAIDRANRSHSLASVLNRQMHDAMVRQKSLSDPADIQAQSQLISDLRRRLERETKAFPEYA